MSIEVATNSSRSPTITIEAAKESIQIARATSQQIGSAVVIAVTDAAANLKVFKCTDARPFLTANVAIEKAWTAAAFGLSTRRNGSRFLRTHVFCSLRIARGL